MCVTKRRYYDWFLYCVINILKIKDYSDIVYHITIIFVMLKKYDFTKLFSFNELTNIKLNKYIITKKKLIDIFNKCFNI